MTPETIDTIPAMVEPECTHQAGCPRHGDVRDCDPAPAPSAVEIARHKAAAERHEYIAGLRELADLLQAHPELEMPYTGSTAPILVLPIRQHQREQLAAWCRALPGKKDKSPREKYFDLAGSVRGLRIEVICHRDEVCERVVLGSRKVTEEIPDPDAVAALPLIRRTRTEEIVEWRCGSVLGGAER